MEAQNSRMRERNAAAGASLPPTFRDLLAIAFHHRRMIVLSFVGISLGAIIAAVLLPEQYESRMKILVNRERVDPIVTAEPAAQRQFAEAVSEQELNSEAELLKSRDLLEKVVLACRLHLPASTPVWSRLFPVLNAHAAGSFTENDPRVPLAARDLDKKLKVEPMTKTNLILVSYRASDPEQAAHVLTALGNLYLEKHVTVHRPTGALEFFQQETDQYREALTGAESRLVSLTRGDGAISPELEKNIALQKLHDFDAALGQTRVAIAETTERIHALQNQASSTPPRIVTEERTSDNGQLFQQLQATLLGLELKRTELLTKFDPSYRLVQEVEAQIAQTKNAISQAEKVPVREQITNRDPTHDWAREELAKAKADLVALKARADATQAVVRAYRVNAEALDQKEMVHKDLVRVVKAAEDNYLLYLRKQEEARISDELDRRRIVNVAIAEPANVPSLPAWPRSSVVLMGCCLAGVMSLGLAFGSEYVSPTFRTPEDVKSFLNIPVLASFPKNDVES